MTIDMHPFRRIEQERALSTTAHNIHTMLALHRVVSHANATHLLGLELPSEQVYIAALQRLAELQRELDRARSALPQGDHQP